MLCLMDKRTRIYFVGVTFQFYFFNSFGAFSFSTRQIVNLLWLFEEALRRNGFSHEIQMRYLRWPQHLWNSQPIALWSKHWKVINEIGFLPFNFNFWKIIFVLKKPTRKRKLYLSLPLLSSQGRQKLRGVDFINQITSFLQHGHDQLPLLSQLA